jgi:NAD(P)-dependent dehydrogenase (short-subunit alcohol dehydrogenase family)
MIAGVAGTAVAVAAAAIWYFHQVFGIDLVTAAYFVVTTMSTTGYGDLTPQPYGPVPMLVGMALMFAGVGFFGIFTALLTTRLARAHAVRIHGLRRVHRRGHVLVCGAGNIGIAVVEYLLEQGRRLVVVERQPDPVLIVWAQERRLELLTGDATRDATLDLCNLGEAHSVVALTNSDTTNLETALGARARNPLLPCVLRIADAEFAASIARHFGFATTFSAAALAAPAFIGLARFANRRGRVSFAGSDYGIGDEAVTDVPPDWAGRGGIPLALWRDGTFLPVREAAELRPGDRALYLLPLAPSGKDSTHEAADSESATA